MYRLVTFIKRGWVTMLSYRTAAALQVVTMFLGVASFFFLSKLVGSSDYLRQYGGDYLPFIILGVVFQSFISTSLGSFTSSISGEQKMGTLEYLLMSRTSLVTVLTFSSLWSFLITAVQAGVTTGLAVLVFGLQLHANVGLAALVLLLTVAGMSGLGMVSAGVIMVTKQGDPVTWLFSTLSGLLSGVYFPIEVLPKAGRALAQLLPTTHALYAMRRALLLNASPQDVAGELLWLAAFAMLALVVGVYTFNWGFDKARRDGTLGFH